MKATILTLALLCAFSTPVLGSPSEYHKYFGVDLSQPLPQLSVLSSKYAAPESYDRYYDYSWNIGQNFDRAVTNIITSYGISEKRLPSKNEEMILEMLNMMPKETWEYIGPYLHIVPGMSEKVLNLPGIKETKNRFPQRIAPQLQNIEGLEFLSPSLYFVLMPEAWPENLKNIERPNIKAPVPKATYDPQFFSNLEKIVPQQKFYADAKPDTTITRSDFRTVKPTKNSLITLTDIKAVSKTFAEVGELGKDDKLLMDLYRTSRLLDTWETENEQGIELPVIKDLVNPCSRLVQKMRLIGEENKLALITAKQGFTPEEWGYTCDKTIRAFRASQMSTSTMLSIIGYKQDAARDIIAQMPPKVARRQEILMQSVVEMYDAPFSDILEARKYNRELKEIFKNLNNTLVGTTIRVLD